MYICNCILYVLVMKCVVYKCCIKEVWNGSILMRNFFFVKVMYNICLKNFIIMIFLDIYVFFIDLMYVLV